MLGLGVRGVGWREIEILPNWAGAPQVRLHARAAARAAALDLEDVTVSISHEGARWRSPSRSPTGARAAEPMVVTPLTQRWVAGRLPPRPERAHKGDFGRVLVVAGSTEYAGAAMLAGLGAARAGAGVVTVAAAQSVAGRLPRRCRS